MIRHLDARRVMVLVRWLLIAVTAIAGLGLWSGGQCDDVAAVPAGPPAAATQTVQRHEAALREAPDAARSDAGAAADEPDCCAPVALTTAKAVRADGPQLSPAERVVPRQPSPTAPALIDRRGMPLAVAVTLTQIGISRT